MKKKNKPVIAPANLFIKFIIFIIFISVIVLPRFRSKILSSFSQLLPSNNVTLVAVGDIMLGRYVNVQIQRQKDWRYPFLKTASFTSDADITFGNLEAPIVESCPTRSDGMIFCARPESIEGLKFAGFDILSLANNHTLNYGQKGLDQTQKFLSSSNILYSPLTSSNNQDNKITKYQVNNTTFGFLSFDLVTYPQQLTFTHDREQMSIIELITSAAKDSDILVVSLHWGNEYQKQPTKSQVELARQIIDNGAKIIIGHHPHVTQPVEKYKDGLIFYSLGNFVFDQPWSEETKKGAIAKIVFEGKEIKSYELIPIYIENSSQPKIVQ